MATSTTTKTTTTPARTRARKTPVPTAKAEGTQRITVELEYERDTTRYAVFAVPGNLNGTMVGKLYAPLGTKVVKVLIVGDEDTDATE